MYLQVGNAYSSDIASDEALEPDVSRLLSRCSWLAEKRPSRTGGTKQQSCRSSTSDLG